MIFPTLVFAVEKWKFNHEFGVYVSTLGNFKDRHKRNLPIKIQQSTGYCAVTTEKGIMKTHRLVLMTWRPIPNREAMTVDHLNHNKRDNSLRNLEWVSKEENLRRAARDICNLKDDLEQDNVKRNDKYLKVNGIKMSTTEAIKFITYGPSGKAFFKDDLKKYLTTDLSKKYEKEKSSENLLSNKIKLIDFETI